MGIEITTEVSEELARLLAEAESAAGDPDDMTIQLLREGTARPLSVDDAIALLDRVVARIEAGAAARDDAQLIEAIRRTRDSLRQRVVADRGGAGRSHSGSSGRRPRVVLEADGDIGVRPVYPRPTFHGREIPMNSGFVDVRDIRLWADNERLEVHVEQFRRIWGRDPEPHELLDIMCSKAQLPGLEDENDQFEIVALARSIASNGVRRPPVIDLDGTLLDGNRRIAACHWVLASDEFDIEQKRRAQRIFVWQLTEHADPGDRERVVVALNFERDLKQDWPEYVKARKVAEEWQSILALEPTRPSKNRAAELKRELSMDFALGPETTVVNRYIKMVDLADEFEEHQSSDRGHDPSAVKHAASRYFQYFDELTKGQKPGQVAYTLNQDDALRHLVFDLLYQGKFSSWRQVRKLKYAGDNEEMVEQLRLARDMEDAEDAQDKVEFAMSLGETASRETRELGANTRIRAFTDWLTSLPLGSFESQAVHPDNIERLLKALVLARQQAIPVLGAERVEELTQLRLFA
jgi:hypothetical protein